MSRKQPNPVVTYGLLATLAGLLIHAAGAYTPKKTKK